MTFLALSCSTVTKGYAEDLKEYESNSFFWEKSAVLPSTICVYINVMRAPQEESVHYFFL